MHVTWNEIFPGLTEPVVGEPEAYYFAAATVNHLADETAQCADAFRQIAADQAGRHVRGETADALAHMVRGIDSSFHRVPGVFKTVAEILHRHAGQIDSLRAEAQVALARATTRWKALKAAERDHASASAALVGIDRQIASLSPLAISDPGAAGELRCLEQRRSEVAGVQHEQCRLIEVNKDRLALSRRDHRVLQENEHSEVGRTASRLESVDLGELEDPCILLEWLQGAIGAVRDWSQHFWAEIVALVDAGLQSRWGDFLWHLSNVLGDVLVVLSVLACLVSVIALFTPLAPFAAALMTLLTFTSAAKLVLTGWIFVSQAPNPATGEPMTALDLAIELGTAVLAFGLGKLIAGPLARALGLPRLRFPMAGKPKPAKPAPSAAKPTIRPMRPIKRNDSKGDQAKIPMSPKKTDAFNLNSRVEASSGAGLLTVYTKNDVKALSDWMHELGTIQRLDVMRVPRGLVLESVERGLAINDGLIQIGVDLGVYLTEVGTTSMTQAGLAKIGTNLNAVDTLRLTGHSSAGAGASLHVCRS